MFIEFLSWSKDNQDGSVVPQYNTPWSDRTRLFDKEYPIQYKRRLIDRARLLSLMRNKGQEEPLKSPTGQVNSPIVSPEGDKLSWR